jgi:uncharacterized membrane protein YdjX (TVP38/TMEM64 family)
MNTMPHVSTGVDESVAHRRVWVQRCAVAAIWIGATVAWRRYQTSNGLSATGAGQEFIDSVEMAWWGVFAYVAVYLARPIVLFPASVLTVVGGVLFGPVAGVIIVIVAANGSATIAYLVGRLLGHTPGDRVDEEGDQPATTVISRWSAKMRNNSFVTVLVMRFLFLPYDLVNYAAGALRIRYVPFIAATALGSLPGTISFVLLGASLDRVDQGLGGIDPIALTFSVVIFVASLAIARVVKRRQAVTTDPDHFLTEQRTT